MFATDRTVSFMTDKLVTKNTRVRRGFSEDAASGSWPKKGLIPRSVWAVSN